MMAAYKGREMKTTNEQFKASDFVCEWDCEGLRWKLCTLDDSVLLYGIEPGTAIRRVDMLIDEEFNWPSEDVRRAFGNLLRRWEAADVRLEGRDVHVLSEAKRGDGGESPWWVLVGDVEDRDVHNALLK